MRTTCRASLPSACSRRLQARREPFRAAGQPDLHIEVSAGSTARRSAPAQEICMTREFLDLIFNEMLMSFAAQTWPRTQPFKTITHSSSRARLPGVWPTGSWGLADSVIGPDAGRSSDANGVSVQVRRRSSYPPSRRYYHGHA